MAFLRNERSFLYVAFQVTQRLMHEVSWLAAPDHIRDEQLSRHLCPEQRPGIP